MKKELLVRPPDGVPMLVQRDRYVFGKWILLQRLGYDCVKRSTIEKQLDLILTGRTDELSAIGKEMVREIVVP